jgi:hypothetical protein
MLHSTREPVSTVRAPAVLRSGTVADNHTSRGCARGDGVCGGLRWLWLPDLARPQVIEFSATGPFGWVIQTPPAGHDRRFADAAEILPTPPPALTRLTRQIRRSAGAAEAASPAITATLPKIPAGPLSRDPQTTLCPCVRGGWLNVGVIRQVGLVSSCDHGTSSSENSASSAAAL